MTRAVYEDDYMVITRFVGPGGCPGVQITPKESGKEMVLLPTDEYLRVLIREREG